MASANGFDVIDCHSCGGIKHIVPIPTDEELERAYSHDYYAREKPFYIERHREDLRWWNQVYAHRFDVFEEQLPAGRRRLLDIGSGPGYFLLNGQGRGWTVMGVEPSVQAAEHSRSLGLDVRDVFFSDETAEALGTFDVVNMGEVLEHIPDPAALLSLIHRRLDAFGLVCIVVPNDFNPFQIVLRDQLGFAPWWVAPPHHINYFDSDSLTRLLDRCAFDVVKREVTFPIDMFLLMGDNYIGNDFLGRECHEKRRRFEDALLRGGQDQLLYDLYAAFAKHGVGRDLVFYARKRGGTSG